MADDDFPAAPSASTAGLASSTAGPTSSTTGLAHAAGRGASATFAGQVVRIGVQLAGIVILGRLLAPSDYGLVASITAIIGIGEVIRNFGLSMAAIQARELSREQKDNLFWINSLIGLVLSAAAFLLSPAIAALYGDPRLLALTQALSITFLLNGISTQFRADLNRKLRLLPLAGTEIGAQLGGLAVGITMAIHGLGYWALAGQQISQGLFAIALLVPVTGWFPGRFHRRTPLAHLLKFASSLTGTQLLGYVSRNTDSVVIGATLGAGPLGLYNRAFQLLLLPLNQINAPSTRVALPVLSRLHEEKDRYDRFLLLGQTIVLHTATLVLAYCCAQATPIIRIALGEQWLASAPIFQILALAGFFEAAGYATYWVFLSKGLSTQNLYFSLATRPLLIACVLVGSLWGVYGVAAGYSLGVGLIWPIGLWWISRVCDAPAKKMFLSGVRAVLGCSMAVAASYFSTVWIPTDHPLASLMLGGVTLLAAVTILAVIWPSYRRDLTAILRSRRFFGGNRTAPNRTQSGSTQPGKPRKPRRIVRAIRGRIRRSIRSLLAESRLGFALDRSAFNRGFSRDIADHGDSEESAPRIHLLIAPPGEGNIGDQSMVESFLENTTGRVIVLVRRVNDIRIPPSHATRSQLLALPALIYGTGSSHRHDIIAYAALVRKALSVTVVGADIMDGVYSTRGSVRRSQLAALASMSGVYSQILGFSWNARPHRGALISLRRADRAGTRLLLRDPVSAARARANGLAGVTEVADAVFSATTVATTILAETIAECVGETRPRYVVINVSGMTSRSMDQTTEYATVIRWLRDAGLTVVLLPHVIRPSADDQVACSVLFSRLTEHAAIDPGLIFVDRLLEPAEVRGLCAEAEFVLTGRMHLAIHALWSGVPAITVSTQGKVEGMLSLVGTAELCVCTGAGFAEQVIPLMAQILADPIELRGRISIRLPRLRELAQLNFSALTSLETAADSRAAATATQTPTALLDRKDQTRT
ncbi:MAG: oligosaccharide flippase family protein [Microbacteriaceae bacterium]|nr:oligosaccharide flippase family protein [Microbacteriaceae bacterium]